MRIRNLQLKQSNSDMPRIIEIFRGQGLPDNCFPPLLMPGVKQKAIANPRFVVKKVVEEHGGRVVMAGFLKITSEAFLILDHSAQNPEWRWEALQKLVEEVAKEARIKGIDCITAFVPNELTDSFGPRLETMKFVRSPWASFSLLL